MPTPHEMYDEAIALKREGDLDACVDKLLEVVAIDPDHSDSHSALAVFQQKLGRFEEAIEHAKKVVELMPNDAFAYTQLSVVLMRCGRIPEAEDAKAKAHAVQAGGGCH